MEIIVRNNFSTDDTLAFLRSLNDPRVRVVEAEVPASAGENWTAVALLAQGTYTKLLCADDTVLPGGLARQLQAALDHPEAALVASPRRIISDTGEVVVRSHGVSGWAGETPGPAAARRAALSGTNPFGEPSSVLFRTSALREALPFTEEYPYLTDLDCYLRVLREGSFLGLTTVDATFRLSASSWSQSIGSSQLGAYRAWIDHVADQAIVPMTRGELARAKARATFRFALRRLATLVAPVLGVVRRRRRR
jgi:glycosyltransferase involved in cell wall biosynthesis